MKTLAWRLAVLAKLQRVISHVMAVPSPQSTVLSPQPQWLEIRAYGLWLMALQCT